MKQKLKIVGFLAAIVAGATLPADTLTWSGGDGTWDATSLNRPGSPARRPCSRTTAAP